jgi:hypothetical protein
MPAPGYKRGRGGDHAKQIQDSLASSTGRGRPGRKVSVARQSSILTDWLCRRVGKPCPHCGEGKKPASRCKTCGGDGLVYDDAFAAVLREAHEAGPSARDVYASSVWLFRQLIDDYEAGDIDAPAFQRSAAGLLDLQRKLADAEKPKDTAPGIVNIVSFDVGALAAQIDRGEIRDMDALRLHLGTLSAAATDDAGDELPIAGGRHATIDLEADAPEDGGE